MNPAQKRDKLADTIERKIRECGTSLEVYCFIKRLTKTVLSDIESDCVKDANRLYDKHKEDDGKMIVDGMELSRNPISKKFKYSNAVVAMENELKAKKKTEQETGIAEDITKPRDPAKNPEFKVKVG